MIFALATQSDIIVTLVTLATHRDTVVTSVTLAALRTLPVLVPDVVTQAHVAVDFSVTLVLRGAVFGYVILFLRSLKIKSTYYITT